MYESRQVWRVLIPGAAAAALAIGAVAATRAQRPARPSGPEKRAAAPKFEKSVRDAFFLDAREKLVGPRPQPRSGDKPAAGASATPLADAPGETGETAWSRLLATEDVEDEIKTQQIRLAALVQNPLQFKGGGFQQARQSLSVLAALFGIVAQYDGRVRWQDEAAAMRDRVARAGFACKVGTDASYREAKVLADDLQILVRGGSPPLGEAKEVPWPEVADRPPLMQRLEQAQQDGIAAFTANPKQFEDNADRLAHEAAIVAALAEVITREGYEFADDETYLQYAREMQAQALQVRDAARQSNYEGARQAAGKLGKSCSSCHEGYRS